jgi:hypothetical protein
MIEIESEQCLTDVESERCRQQLFLLSNPSCLHLRLHTGSNIMSDRLYRQSEARRDGPVIRWICLMTSIAELLHPRWHNRPPQNTIAPRWHTTFLRRIIFRRPWVIFVRRCKSKRSLHEVPESESSILLHFFQELVVDEECVVFARMYGGNDGFAPLVNAIVHVTAELGKVSASTTRSTCTELTITISWSRTMDPFPPPA